MNINHNTACRDRGGIIGEAKCPGCGSRRDLYACNSKETEGKYCIVSPLNKPHVKLTIDGVDAGRVASSELPCCKVCEHIKNPVVAVAAYAGKASRSFGELLNSLEGDVFFVDIGAHDGKFQNEFRSLALKRNWSGIMVEPVVEFYRELEAGLKDYPQIKTINAAVTNRNGQGMMRVSNESSDPTWLRASATSSRLNRELCRGREWHDESVREIKLDVVLDGVERVDAICIDAEGFDWIILSQFPFDRLRPKAIKVEVGNLGDADVRKVAGLLERHGYEWWVKDDWDIVAMPSELAHPSVDIVVPCIAQDGERFKILQRSLDKFSSIDGSRHLIVPADQMAWFTTIASNWNIISERSLIPSPTGSGWFVQQALKLAASQIVKSPFYLLLDADCFATSPVSHRDLVIDGKGIVDYRQPIVQVSQGASEAQLERRRQRIERRRLNKVDSSQAHPWYRVPAELLDCPMVGGTLNVTPFVMSTEIAKSVGQRLTEVHGWKNPWQELLLVDQPNGNWTEYTLYQTWASFSGMLWAKHVHYGDAGVKALNKHCVWVKGEEHQWKPEVAFDGSSLFSLVQSRTGLPAAWTWERIKGYF